MGITPEKYKKQTMRTFKGLTGDNLERWFKDLIQGEFKFENYFESNGQISLDQIDPAQSEGEHLELDGLLLINKTCIIFEYTDQANGHKNKIKKFIRNSHLFVNSNHLTLKQKFELFGVSEEKLDEFEEVENWKFVFFGTSDTFEKSKTKREDFPDLPDIQKELHIFRPTQLEYLRQLSGLLNKYSKNEFLASIDFSAEELGIEETIHLDFIKLQGKYITSDKKLKADIYLTKIGVEKLLQIARVSRHEGIPFILDDSTDRSYQRLLIQRKLKSISTNFIKNDKTMSYPNTLTLVLSNDCIENNGKLDIPKRFSSIDVIDGQHRLFAYTSSSISDEVREDSEILVSLIKFRDSSSEQISKYSAKVFCDINSTQAKVKNNLLYLIKYDVLGDRDYKALAGKVLLECDKAYQKALSNMLLTNTLKKKNRLDLPSIPITTIIDNDLIPFLKGLKTDKSEISEVDYTRVFGNNRAYYKNNPGKFWRASKIIIEQYFNKIQRTFPFDWKDNSDTYLHSSIYYSSFIRFLRFKLFNEQKNLVDIDQELIDLKTEVDKIVLPNNSPSFPRTGNKVPSVKRGIGKVFEFLKTPAPQ